MRYQFYTYTLLFIGFLSFQACSKDSTVNNVPVIKFLDVNSTEIKEFKDSLIIRFEYIDEDGDIGENDPDINPLLIKDRRLSEADFYFVKPLSPPNSGIKIQGVISVQIKNTFLLGTGNSEITQFDIKLRDRAGNWSNNISTPQITITK
jgi:hypothetical protein